MGRTDAQRIGVAVLQAVAREADADPSAIIPDAKLKDYGLDSSSIDMLCLYLEARLSIEIPGGYLDRATDARSVASLICRLAGVADAPYAP